MKKPDFIIVGAAKAGTSSLASYLENHPDVFFTKPKEINFFNRPRTEDELAEYASFFSDANGKIAGEGSVSYLNYSDVTAPQLKGYFPDVKLIFILRNPVQRYFSDFWFNIGRGAVIYKKNLFDDLLFKKETRKDPGNGKLDYRDNLIDKGDYAKHLKKFYHHFDSSQMLIIFFEDFVNKKEQVLKTVFDFIGVKEKAIKNVDKIYNETKYPGKLMFVYVLWKKIKKILPQSFVIKYRKKLIRIKNLFFSQKKPSLSAKAKAELKKIYLPSIVELEKLTKRDLSAWKK